MPVDEDLGPLQDAKDILELKPTFTDEEKPIAERLRPQLRAIMRSEIRTELEASYIKKQKAFEDEITKASREAVQIAIANWKDEQKPLDKDEISTLLSQEYMMFEAPFNLRDGRTARFNLVELPQAVEAKFLKTLRTRFVPLLKANAAAGFKMELNSSTAEKLQSLIEAIPEVLDVLAELVAICLDPWEENKEYGEINEHWVKKHMATHRILAVIIGQMEVQRYRDFFLNGFRLSKSLTQNR
jgi:hypothetical protein